MSADDNKKGFTPAEATLFFSVFKHNKAKVEIDWDKVAAECNFKNASTAKVRFGQIKRKHCPGEGGSLPSSPTGVKKSTPRRGAKGKGKVIKPESATQEETGKNEDSEECNFGLNFKDDEDEELARFSMS